MIVCLWSGGYTLFIHCVWLLWYILFVLKCVLKALEIAIDHVHITYIYSSKLHLHFQLFSCLLTKLQTFTPSWIAHKCHLSALSKFWLVFRCVACSNPASIHLEVIDAVKISKRERKFHACRIHAACTGFTYHAHKHHVRQRITNEFPGSVHFNSNLLRVRMNARMHVAGAGSEHTPKLTFQF